LPNGNTLIDFGNLQLKGLGSIVTEVTPENEVVFQLEYANGSNLYRAHKHDWFFGASILGCTDFYACNYNDEATENDQSCTYVDGICDTCEEGVVIDNDIDDDGICDDDSVIPVHTPQRTLIKITNVLGQEIPPLPNTTLFYLFDDGTIEKRVILD
jgi:hypothetical protein